MPEQQYETKERKKKTFTSVKFSTSNFALAPAVRKSYKDIEDSLTAEDWDILEVKEFRNMLEAYSYEMRNNLDSYGSFEKYLDEATKTKFLVDINQVVDWLYGEGESAPKNEYKTRLDRFKAIGEPVRQRHFYYSELDVYFDQFSQLVQKINEKKDTIIHLTDDQKAEIDKKVEVATSLMQGVKDDRAAK